MNLVVNGHGRLLGFVSGGIPTSPARQNGNIDESPLLFRSRSADPHPGWNVRQLPQDGTSPLNTRIWCISRAQCCTSCVFPQPAMARSALALRQLQHRRRGFSSTCDAATLFASRSQASLRISGAQETPPDAHCCGFRSHSLHNPEILPNFALCHCTEGPSHSRSGPLHFLSDWSASHTRLGRNR